MDAIQDFLNSYPHGEFYPVTNEWRPTSLLPSSQTSQLLIKALGLYQVIVQIEPDLMLTDRSTQYLQRIRRMGVNLKKAQFARLSDQLKFITCVGEFYQDVSYLLRWLRYEFASSL